MHITEKISAQMKIPFISTECHNIQAIQFITNGVNNNIDVLLTFVYDQEQFLLTLQFNNVTKFFCERGYATCGQVGFDLGELLFYDDEGEDGAPLHIGDELGSFSLICNDVKFISIEDIR